MTIVWQINLLKNVGNLCHKKISFGELALACQITQTSIVYKMIQQKNIIFPEIILLVSRVHNIYTEESILLSNKVAKRVA